ncbi:MAG: hypothetical protein JO264_09890 [Acidisphaera sp.]|nr:hypothetical protein [Acidisphaera sp.]
MNRVHFALVALIALLSFAIAAELREMAELKQALQERPPASAASPTAPAGSPTASPADVDHSAELASTLQQRPLFSPDRRPPAGPEVRGATAQPLPRLTGIMVTATERRVIFAGDDKPLVLQEGDRLGAFSVTSIAVGKVTVLGPGGAQVLQPSFSSTPAAAAPATVPAAPSILETLQQGHPPTVALPPPPTVESMMDRRQAEADAARAHGRPRP